MKKRFTAIALILAALMLLALPGACAENAAPETSEPVDPLVGAWRMPPTPFGEDFKAYVVLNADGSFMNVTCFYENDSDPKPSMQTVVTNESFVWVRTGETTLELHYDYHDDNGEFVTELEYDPEADALYFWDTLYGLRDEDFELE